MHTEKRRKAGKIKHNGIPNTTRPKTEKTETEESARA